MAEELRKSGGRLVESRRNVLRRGWRKDGGVEVHWGPIDPRHCLQGPPYTEVREPEFWDRNFDPEVQGTSAPRSGTSTPMFGTSTLNADVSNVAPGFGCQTLIPRYMAVCVFMVAGPHATASLLGGLPELVVSVISHFCLSAHPLFPT